MGAKKSQLIKSGEPHTILVVDDDVVFRSFEAQLLSGQGYKVLQAANGAEALRLAGTETIHLLLTDFSMPDLDGLELSRKFRTAHPQIPILMVSGALTTADHKLEMLPGLGFLPKPFAMDELLLKVQALIGLGRRAI